MCTHRVLLKSNKGGGNQLLNWGVGEHLTTSTAVARGGLWECSPIKFSFDPGYYFDENILAALVHTRLDNLGCCSQGSC